MLRLALVVVFAVSAAPLRAQPPDIGPGECVAPYGFRYLAFTPDDKHLIAFGYDASVRLFDAATGAPGRVLWLPRRMAYGHREAVALAPDSRRLAVPAGDRFLVVDLAAGRVTGVARGHTGAVTAVEFAPDGATLASVGLDRTVRLWDADTLRPKAAFAGVGRREFWAVSWAPDGKALATAELDGPVRLWDVKTGTHRTLTDDDTIGYRLLWRPDGKALAVMAHPHPWRVYDRTGALLLADDGRRWNYAAARFDRAGAFLVPPHGAADASFRLVAADTGKAGRAAPTHPKVGEGVAVSAGGDRFAHYGPGGELVIRALADGKEVARTPTPPREFPTNAGWSADGKSLYWTATKQAGGAVERAFHLAELRLGTPPPGAARTAPVKADADRAIAAEGDYGYTLTRRAGRKTVTLEPSRTADNFLVRGVTLLAGERAAVASDWGVALHDTTTGKELFPYRAPGAGERLAPSPDGRFFVTDGSLGVFSTRGPDPVLSLHVVGEKWVLWTPTGDYATNVDGELPIGRFLDHGPDALAEFVPLDRTPGRNRPDALRRLLDAGK